jgi:GR25 family glycosyltransferase involved in LPS biosynthesis
MKLAYQIFNIPGINEERDRNKSLIETSLELPNLGSPTMTSQDPCPLGFTKQFKPGEVGLWNSTVTALRHFVDSDYDALLILEDDILLNPGFLAGAQEYLERLPMLWDYFYQYVHSWQGANNFNMSYVYGDSKLCRSYQVWSNACFWVSKEGAHKLLKAVANPIEEAVDWYILKRGMEKSWNVYTLQPGVEMYCNIGGFKTTIQDG